MAGLEEDSEKCLKCKVVLLGNSSVGKTSIINRYTKNFFKEVIMSTPGPNFALKDVEFPEEKKKVRFEIWDTAGQERYRALVKSFYTNASSCVLVYDITSRKSFEDIQNYWVSELKNNAPNISM